MVADYPYMCSLLIIKGKNRSKKLCGSEPIKIVTPYNKRQVDFLMQNNEDWVLALQGYIGQIKYHYPRHPLIKFSKNVEFIFPTCFSHEPLITASNVFTDGSSSGRAAVYAPNYGYWVQEGPPTSAQQTKIRAVLLALTKISQPFNLYTDSKYVVNLFPAIETATLSGKSPILILLQNLQELLQKKYIKCLWDI